MKNIRKIVSLITGVVMAFSAFSFNTVSAEEETKIYTLKELLEMSDEEFFSVSGYDESSISNFIDSFSLHNYDLGNCTFTLLIDEWYQANYSEKVVYELFKEAELNGEEIKYKLYSPIHYGEYNPEYKYFYQFFMTISIENDGYTYTIANEENVGDILRIQFCLGQLQKATYEGHIVGTLYDNGEEIITGDVNVDKTTDVFDAVYIAKDTVGEIEFTDFQKQIGDVNSDSEVDVFDAVAIAKETVK